MPSDIQTGAATVHGISNSGNAATIDCYATFTLESLKGSHKFNLGDLKDEDGYDKALIATNGFREFDITIVPTGATRANAANIANISLTPLQKIVLANFKVSKVNGNYVYVGDEGLELSAGDKAKVSLRIRKYDDPTQNSSLTTTVS